MPLIVKVNVRLTVYAFAKRTYIIENKMITFITTFCGGSL